MTIEHISFRESFKPKSQNNFRFPLKEHIVVINIKKVIYSLTVIHFSSEK